MSEYKVCNPSIAGRLAFIIRCTQIHLYLGVHRGLVIWPITSPKLELLGLDLAIDSGLQVHLPSVFECDMNVLPPRDVTVDCTVHPAADKAKCAEGCQCL